jgi:site-specific DNA-methyltransferase (adenine-specific)
MTTLERPSLLLGDCLERLRELPDCSVDSVVTDPPYGLSFMGKKWDYDVPSVEVWAECLRVLKPGGYLLAFAGTRTQHRMAVRIEDAGFEIRDMIAWVYGSGFPKSLDVSKAIDKAAGAEREVVGRSENGIAGGTGKHAGQEKAYGFSSEFDLTAPATEAAKQWEGWGTALKPALEPITVARKPLGEKTVAANVLAHGTGAINVDGGRVGAETWTRKGGEYSTPYGSSTTWNISKTPDINRTATGRWPANLIHDGSDEVLGLFPVTGASKAAPRGGTNPNPMDWGNGRTDGDIVKGHTDNGGSAARFFYCAKASKKDREGSTHPTMKPTALMRYLCRLVTPPEGIVLDLFMGSGSTGKAAITEGFEFIGIERDNTYFEIAKKRIEKAIANVVLDNDL